MQREGQQPQNEATAVTGTLTCVCRRRAVQLKGEQSGLKRRVVQHSWLRSGYDNFGPRMHQNVVFKTSPGLQTFSRDSALQMQPCGARVTSSRVRATSANLMGFRH